MKSDRARYGNTDTTAPGKASRQVLQYQGVRGGEYPPPKSIGVLRGKSKSAQDRERGRKPGTSRPGFPLLPTE
jgi:hypothetical protein